MKDKELLLTRLKGLGYKTKELSKQKNFSDLFGERENYLIIEENRVVWMVAKENAELWAQKVDEGELASWQFKVSATENSDRFVVCESAHSPTNIDDLIAFDRFLQLGFASGFIVEDQYCRFPTDLVILHQSYHFASDAAQTMKEEAIQRVVELQSEDSEHAVLFNFVGKMKMEAGQLNSAIELFTRANKCNKEYAEPYSNLGTILWEQGMKEKAFHLFQNALLLCHYHQDIQDNFISSGLELACYQDMVKTIHVVKSFNENFTTLDFVMANVLLKLGSQADAKTILSQMNDTTDPNYDAAKNLLKELQ